MRVLVGVAGLLDVPFVLAGHTYVGPDAPRERSGAEAAEEAIGTLPIVLAVGLALVTACVLIWVSAPSTKAKLRALVPKVTIVGVIALPLVAWPVLAGDESDDENAELSVERATSRTGAPELLVSLDEDEVNSLETTNGRTSVRLECFDRDGRVVITRRHRWPFVEEVGFDDPHAHQPVTSEQLRDVARCRLRGTSVPLRGDVEGPLLGGS